MHNQGVIHRDLKPSNILIDKHGQVKIGDLGSAIKVAEKLQNNGEFKPEGFTTWYKSPEIIFGSKSYHFDVDLWSFGCIFYELIFGIPLFSGKNDLHQISLISDFLGTPSEQNWKGFDEMPDYGKIQFISNDGKGFDHFSEFTDSDEIEVIKECIKYGRRSEGKELIKLKYFSDENSLNQNQQKSIRNLISLSFFKKPKMKNNEEIFII